LQVNFQQSRQEDCFRAMDIATQSEAELRAETSCLGNASAEYLLVAPTGRIPNGFGNRPALVCATSVKRKWGRSAPASKARAATRQACSGNGSTWACYAELGKPDHTDRLAQSAAQGTVSGAARVPCTVIHFRAAATAAGHRSAQLTRPLSPALR
jgi:hypothetical protein